MIILRYFLSASGSFYLTQNSIQQRRREIVYVRLSESKYQFRQISQLEYNETGTRNGGRRNLQQLRSPLDEQYPIDSDRRIGIADVVIRPKMSDEVR
jgi:hypothetical protein